MTMLNKSKKPSKCVIMLTMVRTMVVDKMGEAK